MFTAGVASPKVCRNIFNSPSIGLLVVYGFQTVSRHVDFTVQVQCFLAEKLQTATAHAAEVVVAADASRPNRLQVVTRWVANPADGSVQEALSV